MLHNSQRYRRGSAFGANRAFLRPSLSAAQPLRRDLDRGGRRPGEETSRQSYLGGFALGSKNNLYATTRASGVLASNSNVRKVAESAG